MTRTARIMPLIAIVLAGCAGTATPEDPPAVPDPPVVLPASAFPRMSSDAGPVGVDELANEVTHPDELRSMLEEAGFVGGAERTFGGGTGAFSRVLARGLSFDSAAGADAYVAWFRERAPDEIITSERIAPPGVPAGAAVFIHEPDGCCHNDVPVFLAAWRRGSTVLFLHVGGRRATTGAFVDLIEVYDEEA